MSRLVGKVKWFNPTKGYGFIEPTDGSPDVFVHINAVVKSGLTSLNENSSISFELVKDAKGKESAANIELVK